MGARSEGKDRELERETTQTDTSRYVALAGLRHEIYLPALAS